MRLKLYLGVFFTLNLLLSYWASAQTSAIYRFVPKTASTTWSDPQNWHKSTDGGTNWTPCINLTDVNESKVPTSKDDVVFEPGNTLGGKIPAWVPSSGSVSITATGVSSCRNITILNNTQLSLGISAFGAGGSTTPAGTSFNIYGDINWSSSSDKITLGLPIRIYPKLETGNQTINIAGVNYLYANNSPATFSFAAGGNYVISGTITHQNSISVNMANTVFNTDLADITTANLTMTNIPAAGLTLGGKITAGGLGFGNGTLSPLITFNHLKIPASGTVVTYTKLIANTFELTGNIIVGGTTALSFNNLIYNPVNCTQVNINGANGDFGFATGITNNTSYAFNDLTNVNMKNITFSAKSGSGVKHNGIATTITAAMRNLTLNLPSSPVSGTVYNLRTPSYWLEGGVPATCPIDKYCNLVINASSFDNVTASTVTTSMDGGEIRSMNWVSLPAPASKEVQFNMLTSPIYCYGNFILSQDLKISPTSVGGGGNYVIITNDAYTTLPNQVDLKEKSMGRLYVYTSAADIIGNVTIRFVLVANATNVRFQGELLTSYIGVQAGNASFTSKVTINRSLIVSDIQSPIGYYSTLGTSTFKTLEYQLEDNSYGLTAAILTASNSVPYKLYSKGAVSVDDLIITAKSRTLDFSSGIASGNSLTINNSFTTNATDCINSFSIKSANASPYKINYNGTSPVSYFINTENVQSVNPNLSLGTAPVGRNLRWIQPAVAANANWNNNANWYDTDAQAFITCSFSEYDNVLIDEQSFASAGSGTQVMNTSGLACNNLTIAQTTKAIRFAGGTIVNIYGNVTINNSNFTSDIANKLSLSLQKHAGDAATRSVNINSYLWSLALQEGAINITGNKIDVYYLSIDTKDKVDFSLATKIAATLVTLNNGSKNLVWPTGNDFYLDLFGTITNSTGTTVAFENVNFNTIGAINGNNTFNRLRVNLVAPSLTLEAGKTQSVKELLYTGTTCNTAVIKSTTATKANIAFLTTGYNFSPRKMNVTGINFTADPTSVVSFDNESVISNTSLNGVAISGGAALSEQAYGQLGADKVFCSVSDVLNVLGASVFPTTTTYKWYKNGILIPGNTTSSLPVTAAGKYKAQIIYSTPGCLLESNEINVSFRPQVVLVKGAECNQNTTTLTVSNSAQHTGTPAYIWTKDNAPFSPADPINLSGLTSGLYNVSIDYGDAYCKPTASEQITLITPPVVVPSQIICADNTTLSVVNANDYTGKTITWYKFDNDVKGAVVANGLATVSGKYLAELPYDGTCNLSAATQLELRNIPVLGNDIVACGANTAINVQNANQYVGLTAYQLTDPDLIQTSNTSGSFSITKSGNYTVEVTYATGCYPSQSINVDLRAYPTPGQITGLSPVGTNAQGVTYSVSGASANNTYLWSLPEGATAGLLNNPTVDVNFSQFNGGIISFTEQNGTCSTTVSKDLAALKFKYEVVDGSLACGDAGQLVRFRAVEKLGPGTSNDGIIAMDFSLTYDQSKLKVSSANPAYVIGQVATGATAVINSSTPGIVRVAIYYPANVNNVFTGGGTQTTENPAPVADDIISIRLESLAGAAGSTLIESTVGEDLLEGKLTGSFTVAKEQIKSGTFTFAQDGKHLGILEYRESTVVLAGNVAGSNPTKVSACNSSNVVSSTISTTVDANGNFSVDLSGNTKVNITRDIKDETDVNHVFTANDALLAAQISTYYITAPVNSALIAADVNKDGIVTALDATLITKRSTKNIDHFSQNNPSAVLPDWIFATEVQLATINAATTYKRNLIPVISPCMEVATVAPNTCNPLIHYKGILNGDIDASYTTVGNKNLRIEHSSAISLALNEAVKNGNNYIIPVYAVSDSIRALDFAITVDTALIESTSVEVSQPVSFSSNFSNRQILFSGYTSAANFQAFSLTEPILYVNVDTKPSASIRDIFKEFGYVLINGKESKVAIVTSDIDEILLEQGLDLTVSPNPTSGHFTITGVTLSGAKTVNIEILSPSGVLVSSEQAEISGSNFKIDENITPLAAGVYFVKVSFANTVKVIKAVKH